MSSTQTSEFDPNTDEELATWVRTVTGYRDTDNELPESELYSHIGLTKGRLSTEYDIPPNIWFTDKALALALVYGTAIHSKVSVENYSVQKWDFGDESITVGDTDDAQLSKWLSWGNDALDNSDSIDKSSVGPQISADYNFDPYYNGPEYRY